MRGIHLISEGIPVLRWIFPGSRGRIPPYHPYKKVAGKECIFPFGASSGVFPYQVDLSACFSRHIYGYIPGMIRWIPRTPTSQMRYAPQILGRNEYLPIRR